jgi:hypothetical protein
MPTLGINVIVVVQEWRQKGVPFNDQKASRLLIMDSLSRRRIKSEIEDLRKRIDEYEKRPKIPTSRGGQSSE